MGRVMSTTVTDTGEVRQMTYADLAARMHPHHHAGILPALGATLVLAFDAGQRALRLGDDDMIDVTGHIVDDAECEMVTATGMSALMVTMLAFDRWQEWRDQPPVPRWDDMGNYYEA